MSHQIILCVDDDSSVLSALRTLLVKRLLHNQLVEVAESGEEALAILEDLERDGDELAVVIADYIMPGMKGDELLVRLHAKLPQTIKIMLTGQSDMAGVKRAINEAGLFRFLEKPWHNEDIVVTLHSALKTYDLERELHRQNAELRRLNEELEAIVADRTRELTEKNHELEHLAVTDRLTGLYNRLYLDKALEKEFSVAGRHNTPFSLILIDLDQFKRVNDTYGHPAGDAVLQTIAEVLKDKTRQSDTVGRWGGEEFLVICPNTSLAGAVDAAEHLRRHVEQQRFPFVESRTASFGVASYQPGDTIAAIESRADKALYQAKESGRNRVVAL